MGRKRARKPARDLDTLMALARTHVERGEPADAEVLYREVLAGARDPDTVRVGEREHCAGATCVDVGEAQVDAGALRDVERAVADAVGAAPISAVVARVATHDSDAVTEIRRQLVRAPTEDVALVDDGGDDTRQRPVPLVCAGDHSREARMDR